MSIQYEQLDPPGRQERGEPGRVIARATPPATGTAMISARSASDALVGRKRQRRPIG